MKVRTISSIGATIGALALFSVVASAQTTGNSGATEALADQVALRQLYDAHLAANEAAQARGESTPTPEQLAATNFGCPDGTVFWMRDSVTPLCAASCASDDDCSEDEGRCRLLDLNDLSREPPMLLVDDMDPDDVIARLSDETVAKPIATVCDPFFDVVGATDAEARDAPL